ncbi:MAG TPA: iron hydrogenase, partial [Geobacteraceae bacterium]|nr:iron hydrogenase [Geobacteraceae bacterium]
MTITKSPEDEIRVELGEPEPFAGEKKRDLLVAAALGAPFGTTDPVDLALLGAASHKEDLRHFEQLGYTPPTPEQRIGIARIRRVGSEEEELIARGEPEAILYLCRPDQSTRYHAELQAGEEMLHGFRSLGVGHGTIQPDGSEKWQYLGQI